MLHFVTICYTYTRYAAFHLRKLKQLDIHIHREDTQRGYKHTYILLQYVTIRYIYTLKKAGAITHTHTDTQRGYNCSKVQMYIAHYVLLHFHTLCFISLKEAETIRHTFLKCTKFAFYIALYRVQ